MYQQYLGRTPTQVEIDWWSNPSNPINLGGDINKLLPNILNSPEYKGKHPAGTTGTTGTSGTSGVSGTPGAAVSGSSSSTYTPSPTWGASNPIPPVPNQSSSLLGPDNSFGSSSSNYGSNPALPWQTGGGGKGGDSTTDSTSSTSDQSSQGNQGNQSTQNTPSYLPNDPALGNQSSQGNQGNQMIPLPSYPTTTNIFDTGSYDPYSGDPDLINPLNPSQNTGQLNAFPTVSTQTQNPNQQTSATSNPLTNMALTPKQQFYLSLYGFAPPADEAESGQFSEGSLKALQNGGYSGGYEAMAQRRGVKK